MWVDARSLNELENFDSDSWATWLSRLLADQVTSPQVPGGRMAPDELIIALFNEVRTPEAQECLRSGVALAFETTPVFARFERVLYYLLRVISALLPPQAKQVVRRRFQSGALDELNWRGRNLGAEALVTASHFEIDSAFRDSILRWAESPRIDRRLLAFRVLALNEDPAAQAILDALAPFLMPDWESVAVQELRHVASMAGFKQLFSFFLTRSEEGKISEDSPYIDLAGLVRERVCPWPPGPDSSPYKLLLAALLNVGHHLFAASEIVSIAKLADLHPDFVQETQSVLRAIWKCTSKDPANAEYSFPKPRHPDSLLVAPWDCIYLNGDLPMLEEGVGNWDAIDVQTFWRQQEAPDSSRVSGVLSGDAASPRRGQPPVEDGKTLPPESRARAMERAESREARSPQMAASVRLTDHTVASATSRGQGLPPRRRQRHSNASALLTQSGEAPYARLERSSNGKAIEVLELTPVGLEVSWYRRGGRARMEGH